MKVVNSSFAFAVRTSCIRVLPCLGLLVLGIAGLFRPALGQSTPPAAPNAAATGASPEIVARDQAPTFKVNVRLVQVRVVVRDRQGHAVGNLRKEDFLLFDNGKPQLISRFSVEQPGTQLAAAARASPPPSAGQPPASAAVATLPERYVAYLFDDVHLQLSDLMLLRRAASRHFKALQPTDRAAVFTTSGQNQLDFTSDRSQLENALAGLLPRPRDETGGSQCPYMTYYLADLMIDKLDQQAIAAADSDALACAFNNDTGLAAQQGAAALARSTAERFVNSGDAETRLALVALSGAVRRMSVMPGRRTIVLASPGFFVPEQQLELQEIIDRALESNIVVNAIDARGLYTIIPGVDASRHVVAPINPSANGLEGLYQVAEASVDADVMAELADATGGTFFHNNNDLDEGFRRAAAAPEYYYLLAFTPQNLKLDGKFHRLQVKLSGPAAGVTLQARKGYYAPRHAVDAAEQARQEIEDALFSQEESHDIPVELHTQFFKLAGDQARLSVLAHLDVRQLHYQKIDGRNRDEATVVSAVFDHNGRFLHAIQKVLTMRWKDETLRSKLNSGITLRSDFDLQPGSYLVRLIVRDSGGGLAAENGVVEIP